MAIRDPLALTEDQRALRDAVRGFLVGQLPTAALRGMLNGGPGYRPDLHARMAGELGLAGLTVPGRFGGRGLGPAEAGLVHTELGRVLYPGPFLPTCLAATVLLAGADPADPAAAGPAPPAAGAGAGAGAAADHAAARRWLRRLADGSASGTLAVADQDGRWSAGSVRAHLTSPGWRLYGRCWYVIAAHVADVIVVSAQAGSVPAMFGVEAGATGLRSSAQPGPDRTRRVCVTAFDATPAVLLAQGQAAAAALAQVERDFLLATAAEAVGGIGWCLDAAMGYAREPDGVFRSVAHAYVEMLAAFQPAEEAVRRAAAAVADDIDDAYGTSGSDGSDGADRTDGTAAGVRTAAQQAGQAYRAVTEAAIGLFGGIGSSREHDAHLYYRRAWSAERLSGGPGPQARRPASG
jgi:alkylation response protein AidB-like acyl-CoA dehydrogenase